MKADNWPPTAEELKFDQDRFTALSSAVDAATIKTLKPLNLDSPPARPVEATAAKAAIPARPEPDTLQQQFACRHSRKWALAAWRRMRRLAAIFAGMSGVTSPSPILMGCHCKPVCGLIVHMFSTRYKLMQLLGAIIGGMGLACRDHAAPSFGRCNRPRIRHPLPSCRHCRHTARSKVRLRRDEPADVQESTARRCDDCLHRGAGLEAGSPCVCVGLSGGRCSRLLLRAGRGLVQ